MARNSTPNPYSGHDGDILPLVRHSTRPKRRSQSSAGSVDTPVDAESLIPCVVYECTTDLLLTRMSANAVELVGICPENVVDNRLFWDQRVLPEDRTRLVARLNQLAWTEMGSEVHRIANDQGLPVRVVHSFRKEKKGCDITIYGCMIPLGSEFCDNSLDTSIISQFVHKIGNHFQLINLLIGSLKRTATNVDEVEALQQTIDRAVEFTRSFSHYSQKPARAGAVDLGEIVRPVIAAAADACIEKNITFQNVIQESLTGALIGGDAFLLELAFGGILQNAIEATKSGDRISITGNVTDGGPGRSNARIAILDTGCGIEMDILDKASDPFVTSKRDRDGLGLSAALRIIEIHGGTLKISSTQGQGTQISIVLPLVHGPSRDQR